MVPYTLRQLAYFVAAAEGGSVAAAARALNVSQPSVSTAISKLEALIGVQLFLRHRAQGVSLTPTGRRLLAEARSLLSYANELGEQARGLGQAIRGRLEVGCFLTLTPMYMPRLIVSFAAEFPDVDIRLYEGHQDTLLRGLETGRFDLAILYNVNLPSDLELRPLVEMPPYALLPPEHPLAKNQTVSLRRLAPEPLVLLDVPPSREYFSSLFREIGKEPVIRFHSPSFETVRGMVGNGLGYSLLVIRPAGDLTYDGRRIACLRISDKVAPGRIVLARLAQARPTRLSEAFSDYCKSFFSQFSIAPRPSRRARLPDKERRA